MPKPIKKYRVKLIGLNEYAAQKLAEAWAESIREGRTHDRSEIAEIREGNTGSHRESATAR